MKNLRRKKSDKKLLCLQTMKRSYSALQRPSHFCFQDILLKVCANLSFFVWTQELLPLDILLLAFIDRDDDPNALRIVVCSPNFFFSSLLFFFFSSSFYFLTIENDKLVLLYLGNIVLCMYGISLIFSQLYPDLENCF